jgi:Ran GTPase-activating protein (RanGAP) involved in mRNA processing and transport
MRIPVRAESDDSTPKEMVLGGNAILESNLNNRTCILVNQSSLSFGIECEDNLCKKIHGFDSVLRLINSSNCPDRLNLSYQNLYDSHVHRLAEGLSLNPCLEYINLSFNHLTTKSVDSLIQALSTNTNIQWINLSHTGIASLRLAEFEQILVNRVFSLKEEECLNIMTSSEGDFEQKKTYQGIKKDLLLRVSLLQNEIQYKMKRTELIQKYA